MDLIFSDDKGYWVLIMKTYFLIIEDLYYVIKWKFIHKNFN